MENLTLGPGAAAYLVESLHGAGSPQAQRIMLARLANLEEKVRLAKRLAGIKDFNIACPSTPRYNSLTQ
jgi:4-hydroxybutyryl-CoA dehydratase/vinylacetyl-CoA-Delta-isomerase